jgi:hypothetical protein
MNKVQSKLGVSHTIQGLYYLNQTTSPDDYRSLLDEVIVRVKQSFSGELEAVPWLLEAGPEYIELLRKGNLVALAVLIHYGVMLLQREDIWWAACTERRVVKKLTVTLARCGDDCIPMVNWCREQVRVREPDRTV